MKSPIKHQKVFKKNFKKITFHFSNQKSKKIGWVFLDFSHGITPKDDIEKYL